MGTKRRIFSILLLLAGLGGYSWMVLGRSEPTYNGKPLSKWLEGYATGSNPEVDVAILHMGTNAIPLLLRELQAEDSEFTLKLLTLARKQTFISISRLDSDHRNFRAELAFWALGPEGRTAVPALIHMYDERPKPELQERVASVLGSIGPSAGAAIPSLIRGLTSTNHAVRASGVSALGRIGAETAIPALLRLTTDTNETVRSHVMDALLIIV